MPSSLLNLSFWQSLEGEPEVYVTPQSAITVTIGRLERLDVAEALRDAARAKRAQFAGRRAKTQSGKFALQGADRLWDLARAIDGQEE